MSATASLANDSLLSQCADFVETMLHRFLKAESEKPTPPTPAELQPAVTTLWRLSTIRKTLSIKPSPSPNPGQIDHAVHSVHKSDPKSLNLPGHVTLNKSLPSEISVSPLAPCNHSPSSSFCNSPPPAPTMKEVFASIRQLESATRAVQREVKLRAAQPNSSPPFSLPSSTPKFRYPPPKRTSV